MQALGWAALPIAFRMLRWLPDRGYAFAKSLGLLLGSYVLWLGATTGFIRNDPGGIAFAILIVTGLSAWLWWRGQDGENGPLRRSLPAFLSDNKKLVWTVEILFTIAFLAWAGLRAFAPYKIMETGGEKFMEIAFLNGILNSPQFPPLDPWLSGFSISYYYFGYVMMAFLTRLSGAPPGIGFDLYDALLFALTIVSVFGVVYNLVTAGQARKIDRTDRWKAGSEQGIRYGLFGSLLVVVMGNLEGLMEVLRSIGALPGSFWHWLDVPGLAEAPATGAWFPGGIGGWWGSVWWRASRIIQDRDLLYQPLGISPITEFPIFSFLLGDNHPHVLALPFVLLGIALAQNLLCRQVHCAGLAAEEMQFAIQERGAVTSSLNLLARAWKPVALSRDVDAGLFLFYALCLGSLGFLNTWDMPIYLGLVVLAYGIGDYAVRRRLNGDLLWRMSALGASLLIAAGLLYFLFYTGFSSQAGGILPHILPPTRLQQYLLMFGIFIYCLTWFLSFSLIAQARQQNQARLLQTVLKTWGWVVLICLAIFVLLIAAISLTGIGQQLIQDALNDPSVQAVTGGLNVAEILQAILVARLADPGLFLLLSLLLALAVANLLTYVKSQPEPTEAFEPAVESASTSQLFTFLLISAGLALTFSVEFFYLRDNFGTRMNTVFKFYYQGWIMLGLASAYATWWLANPGRRMMSRAARSIFLGGSMLLVAGGLIYSGMASYSRLNGFQSQPDLDGASEVARNNPDDWAAITWLRSQLAATEQAGRLARPQDVPVILEAPGKSYNYEGRISAFSGLPAVLGWSHHEGQWRGNYIEQGKREPDIATIYTTADGKQALDLLRRWQVKYVIVGATERLYIERVCVDPNRLVRSCNPALAVRKFDALLKPVFQEGSVTIYAVPGS